MAPRGSGSSHERICFPHIFVRCEWLSAVISRTDNVEPPLVLRFDNVLLSVSLMPRADAFAASMASACGILQKAAAAALLKYDSIKLISDFQAVSASNAPGQL
jgi:hypothetical protein